MSTLVDIEFGLQSANLEEARRLIEACLNVELELRNSIYLGGDYYFTQSGSEQITVQLNRDGDELAEPISPT